MTGVLAVVFEAGVEGFEAAEIGAFDVAAFAVLEVRGAAVLGAPTFGVAGGLGVFKPSSAGGAAGVGSGSTSTGAVGKSFLQFSRKVLGSPFVCLSEAFRALAVRGTSGSSLGSVFFHEDWVTKAGGILREGGDLSPSVTDFGGHSRFSLTSSLAESPVI